MLGDIESEQREAMHRLMNVLEAIRDIPAMGIDNADHEKISDSYWELQAIAQSLLTYLEEKEDWDAKDADSGD